MITCSYAIHRIIDLVLMPLALVGLCLLLLPYYLIQFICGIYRRITAEDVKGKVVLVTGASSGIGEEMSYEYARRGACLAIVARRESHLKKVADKAKQFGSPDVLHISADVSDVNDCKRIVDEAVKHFGRLDHVINNAGISCITTFGDAADISKFTSVMDVNFWGSLYPTYFAIPHLKKTKGKIFVNASAAGVLQPPGLGFYTASKSALISFYEAIRAEIASEVSITIATLGFINTEMVQGKQLSKEGIMKVEPELAINSMFGFPLMGSGDCAKAMVDAVCRKEKRVTEPRWYRAIFMFRTVFPELVFLQLRWVYSRMKAEEEKQQAAACK